MSEPQAAAAAWGKKGNHSLRISEHDMLQKVLLSIAILSFASLLVFISVVGAPRNLTTDKDHPGLEEGYAKYIEPSQYHRAVWTYRILGYVFICSGIAWTLLKLLGQKGWYVEEGFRDLFR